MIVLVIFILLFLILSFYKWFYWKKQSNKFKSLANIYEYEIIDLKLKGRKRR